MWLGANRDVRLLEEENKRLRALLNDVPTIIIDRKVARMRGETELLKYMDAMAAWLKRRDEEIAS